MVHCGIQKLFTDKMLQKLFKKISNGGKVMSNIEVASFYGTHCILQWY